MEPEIGTQKTQGVSVSIENDGAAQFISKNHETLVALGLTFVLAAVEENFLKEEDQVCRRLLLLALEKLAIRDPNINQSIFGEFRMLYERAKSQSQKRYH